MNRETIFRRGRQDLKHMRFALLFPRLLPLPSADVARPAQDLRRLARAVLKHLRRLHLLFLREHEDGATIAQLD